MSGTVVPAVLTALESLIADALDDWVVVDGPVYDVPVSSNFACVGWDGQQGAPGVEATVASPDAGFAGSREAFNVQCALTAHKGTDDLPTLRATGYAAVAAIEAALEGSRDLGIAEVSFAQLTNHSLIQGRTDLGVTVTIPFVVQIQAWSA